MHKLRTAAVLVAAFGTIGLLGAGTAHADQGGHRGGGDTFDVMQTSNCKSHDTNIDILGNIGIGNGLLGINDEGNPGAQQMSQGSSVGCSNTFGK
ncbi:MULTISPECIES: hypothetical protein [Streptomyces]|uniref:Secreted protein n=1 Tax=Streptomyces doebereineriae TaxID=3075528 RepID=A0ABU2VPZ0_9ACTN|nr:hypothetical protein [Streptomyces sp. DSM 41640]MDT0486942.1 hypothetical protein [Streptomyces sp. DSM 41640]